MLVRRRGALAAGAAALALSALAPLAGSMRPTAFASSIARGDSDEVIDAGGLRRTYHLHIPPPYDGTRHVPLVLAFHGGLGTGRAMARLSGLSALADRHGFVVAYPDGVGRSWNDGRAASPASKRSVDDIAFTSALIGALQGRFAIDADRIYATGISNGGFFVQRAAGALPEVIAAVASVAALLAAETPLPAALGRAVPIVFVHGTEDTFVPWQGGLVRGSRGLSLSVETTIARWRALNDCAGAPETAREPDRDPDDGTRVRREAYRACRDGSEVVLYAIEGGGHTWPGGRGLAEWLFGRTSRDINAGDVIWDFFSRHPRR